MRNWMKMRMDFSKKFQQEESEVDNPYVFNPKTSNVLWRNPTPLPRINYQADDALAQWHKEKTKSSMDEAFRTADYATGLWRCETEWDRTKEYLWAILLFIGLLGGLYFLGLWASKVLP